MTLPRGLCVVLISLNQNRLYFWELFPSQQTRSPVQVKLTIIAADLPRVNTEVKHRAEQEGQTSGDIVGGFLIRPLSRTHEFVLNLNLQA